MLGHRNKTEAIRNCLLVLLVQLEKALHPVGRDDGSMKLIIMVFWELVLHIIHALGLVQEANETALDLAVRVNDLQRLGLEKGLEMWSPAPRIDFSSLFSRLFLRNDLETNINSIDIRTFDEIVCVELAKNRNLNRGVAIGDNSFLIAGFDHAALAGTLVGTRRSLDKDINVVVGERELVVMLLGPDGGSVGSLDDKWARNAAQLGRLVPKKVCNTFNNKVDIQRSIVLIFFN